MGDKDSSDEEDVFECGRCKEKFTDMTIFMHHKNEKTCNKVKKQKELTAKERAQELGEVLTSILNSSTNSMTGEGEANTTVASISPTIGDFFTTKAGDKEIDPGHISLDILTSLEHPIKQEQVSTSASCDPCQEWFPDQPVLDNSLREKSTIDTSQLDQVEIEATVESKTHDVHNKPQLDSPVASSDSPVEKSSRRTRQQHSCSVCNLKFLSRFKLEQHCAGRKHRNTVRKLKTNTEQDEVPKRRPGRPSKKRVCKFCGISTDSIKDLQKHLKEQHKGATGKENGDKGAQSDETTNLCRECGALVPRRSLRRHERRCANKKKFECPLCGHQSRERTDYKSHIDNHKVWIEVDKSVVPWDGQSTNTSSRNEDATISNAEQEKIADVSDDADKDEGVILSTSDLAVLGLMPKPKFSTVQECLDALTSGLKGTYDEQISSDKETQGESEVISMNLDNGAEPSSVKINSKQLKCKACKKWFPRRSLSKHMYDVHSMTKQFQCRDVECLQAFIDMDSFRTHITSHSDKLMFQCGCRLCFSNKTAVEEEYADEIRKWKMRKYYSQLSYKCKLCWMKFPSESSLSKHQQSDSHNHRCEQCGKVSVSKRQLRLHQETHQEERGYLCDICGSGFKTDRDLRRHIASHSSNKPFACNECDKAFHFKNKLTRHINTVHATYKPFACNYEGCRKSFARRDKLTDHENTHKAPIYACQYCSKTFYRKDVMREHEIANHTKEFPYNCKMCKKGFLRPKALLNHQAAEHNTSVSPSTLDKLLKASAAVQQRAQNTPLSAAACLAGYVIYDQSISSVLQGTTDNDPQSLPIQPMNLPPSASSSSDLSYQMTDITGSGGTNLTYQVSGGSLPGGSNALHVSLSQPLVEHDV
ncbi:zinc finger protein 84-like [Lytechinus pictus]|uniref:zinc finger protein 84-like n=1 Tax=Lytechinus pictus TaxID=7653 RepID=UPI0030B9EB70